MNDPNENTEARHCVPAGEPANGPTENPTTESANGPTENPTTESATGSVDNPSAGRRDTLRDTLRERLRRRKRSLMRQIEYERLRRIRKRTVPAYAHCKNCGATLQGMYCHRCGQYALDIDQPFWKYIRQYFENVYQFDSKIWQTLYLLFRRPGFLTQEFNLGRINSYVHPLRLFMFLSALFFLFSFFLVPDSVEAVFESDRSDRLPEMQQDSPVHAVFREAKDSVYTDIRTTPPRRVLLPDAIDWNDLESRLSEKAVKQSDADTAQILKIKRNLFYKQLVGWLAKWLPVIVLLLIPLFALLLKAFFRKRKMRYMGHFVLALHLHAGLLILLTLFIGWCLLMGTSAAATQTLLGLFLLYMTLSFHRVYGNGWIKSAVKSVLIYCIYLIFTASVLIAVLIAVVAPLIEENGWS